MVFDISVRSKPARRRTEGRRAAGVFFDTRQPTRRICGSCKPCGIARS